MSSPSIQPGKSMDSFQEQVPARNAGRCLVVRVSGQYCALPLDSVIETMRPLPLRPLPDMPGFLLGASIIRGTLTPVLDGARLLGAGGGEKRGRYVTLRVGGTRVVALAVESVLGIRKLDQQLADLPPLLRTSEASVISGVSSLDADLLLVLRAGLTIPEAVWQAMEAGGTPR